MAINQNEALGAAEALALLESEQRNVQEKMGGFVPAMTAAWGVAWLLGFGALWLVDAVGLPLPVAVTIFIVLLLGAGALSTFFGIRSSRGIRSSWASTFTGTVYGVTWSFGSLALAAIGGGLSFNGLDQDLANYFYPAVFLFFIGIMYIIAGGIWQAPFSIVAGGLLVLIAAGTLFVPASVHFLVIALAAGLTFIALAIVHRARMGR